MPLSKQTYLVWSFNSTHDAMRSYTVASATGASCRLIQLPSHLAQGNECGTALRALPQDADLIQEALEAAGVGIRARAQIEDYA